MNLARQGVSFLLVGLGLVTADWAVFVVLTAIGTPAAMANVLGRVTGALLGFWANGRYTFGAPGAARLGPHRFLRFLVVWLPLTLLSTVLVTVVAARLGMQMAWLAKPLVEAGLAVVSFLVSRHWVYR
ncbi:GtrA family protein [Rhodanobacter caeni]|jgi:putative flippase GtrA|uniref:GtrA family protein n=1 Tax=Rhodanobacter caeni TaxID=657654 RepID=A0ABN0UB61_9GAMM